MKDYNESRTHQLKQWTRQDKAEYFRKILEEQKRTFINKWFVSVKTNDFINLLYTSTYKYGSPVWTRDETLATIVSH